MIDLALVVALPCEARPWVEHYRLTAVADTPFRVWRSERVALVVSGVGSDAAAAATGFVAGHAGTTRTCTWINIGIAGHSRLARGEIAVVDKCVRRADGRTFFPSLPAATPLARSECFTVDGVESDYACDVLYEMECAGFFQAASRLALLDLVHAAKVVSDGPLHSVDALNREVIEALIADALPDLLDGLVDPLLECARRLSDEQAPADLSAWHERWHFSVSNAHRLRETVNDWRVVNTGSMPDPHEFEACRRASDVLTRMRRLLDARPPRWD